MRRYSMSADINDKEKIIGGILTLEQTAWIVGGLVLSGVIFLLLYQMIPIPAALIIGLIPGLAIGLPFALYKPKGLTLLEFIILNKKFKRKSKTLTNGLGEER